MNRAIGVAFGAALVVLVGCEAAPKKAHTDAGVARRLSGPVVSSQPKANTPPGPEAPNLIRQRQPLEKFCEKKAGSKVNCGNTWGSQMLAARALCKGEGDSTGAQLTLTHACGLYHILEMGGGDVWETWYYDGLMLEVAGACVGMADCYGEVPDRRPDNCVPFFKCNLGTGR